MWALCRPSWGGIYVEGGSAKNGAEAVLVLAFVRLLVCFFVCVVFFFFFACLFLFFVPVLLLLLFLLLLLLLRVLLLLLLLRVVLGCVLVRVTCSGPSIQLMTLLGPAWACLGPMSTILGWHLC